jgi:hypothetical protein
MGRFLGFLAASFILGLAASLYNCNPPEAYAVTFKPSFDSVMWNDPQTGAGTGIWHHPLPDDELAVIAWGFWADSVGGSFVPSGSDTVAYADIYDHVFKIPQGSYQFFIYPLYKPESSSVLLWESFGAWKIDKNKTISFAAQTSYFLVMLDTTNTWDFNTGTVNDGYQYAYYLADSSRYWPSYTMDYYCGIKGVDSTLFVYNIDSAKAGVMYAVTCLQSFDIGIRVNLLGVMDSIFWTFHKIE